jgi:hypothetical protein
LYFFDHNHQQRIAYPSHAWYLIIFWGGPTRSIIISWRVVIFSSRAKAKAAGNRWKYQCVLMYFLVTTVVYDTHLLSPLLLS